jgi:hypothetical protein
MESNTESEAESVTGDADLEKAIAIAVGTVVDFHLMGVFSQLPSIGKYF